MVSEHDSARTSDAADPSEVLPRWGKTSAPEKHRQARRTRSPPQESLPLPAIPLNKKLGSRAFISF
jgi:hypothetical protein